MGRTELNLMDTYPDKTWVELYGNTISDMGSLDTDSEISRYITALKEKNIPYVSYFSEIKSGGKYLGYTNKLEIFVKKQDLEKVQYYLVEKGLLCDKSIEEIEELESENANDDLTAQSLPSFNRGLQILFSVFSIVFWWAATIVLAYFSTMVSEGKTALIIVTVAFGLMALVYTVRAFTRIRK